jgi:hypothetical protein
VYLVLEQEATPSGQEAGSQGDRQDLGWHREVRNKQHCSEAWTSFGGALQLGLPAGIPVRTLWKPQELWDSTYHSQKSEDQVKVPETAEGRIQEMHQTHKRETQEEQQDEGKCQKSQQDILQCKHYFIA